MRPLGFHAPPSSVVCPESGLRGLLTDADLSLLFSGRSDLRLIDDEMDIEALPEELKQALTHIEFGQVSRSKRLLESKSSDPPWFKKLYEGMAETPQEFRRTTRQGKRGRFEWVEDPILVLTETGEILSAKCVHLRSIPNQVLELRGQYAEVDELLKT